MPDLRLGGSRLTRAAIDTVRVLTDHGPLAASEIADRLGIEDTAAHRRLQTLEGHDLVVRTFAPAGSQTRYLFDVAPEVAA